MCACICVRAGLGVVGNWQAAHHLWDPPHEEPASWRWHIHSAPVLPRKQVSSGHDDDAWCSCASISCNIISWKKALQSVCDCAILARQAHEPKLCWWTYKWMWLWLLLVQADDASLCAPCRLSILRYLEMTHLGLRIKVQDAGTGKSLNSTITILQPAGMTGAISEAPGTVKCQSWLHQGSHTRSRCSHRLCARHARSEWGLCTGCIRPMCMDFCF